MNCTLALIAPVIGIAYSLIWRSLVKAGRVDDVKIVRFWPLLLMVSLAVAAYVVARCIGA